ncbi:hypothetical protein Ddye_024052 [Dipteronia dyeriana]|uniref:Uncharacterized protein n=1 Tax=Dipteronia dyeriana TaxID=168575 RepID=A0AAD9TV25_9ROSI|nr:hypothetical protein Ddye_024052 [Dipteronia dyeriana]
MSLSFLVKKAIKLFLVSVSIFSIIVSFSFSLYAMQVIANNIDKSYMFLLCNGILVFIVKNSARLVGESQQESDNSSDLINKKKTAKKIHNYQPDVVKLSSEEKQSIIKEVVKEEAHQETEGKQEEQEQEQENHEALIINDAEDNCLPIRQSEEGYCVIMDSGLSLYNLDVFRYVSRYHALGGVNDETPRLSKSSTGTPAMQQSKTGCFTQLTRKWTKSHTRFKTELEIASDRFLDDEENDIDDNGFTYTTDDDDDEA